MARKDRERDYDDLMGRSGSKGNGLRSGSKGSGLRKTSKEAAAGGLDSSGTATVGFKPEVDASEGVIVVGQDDDYVLPDGEPGAADGVAAAGGAAGENFSDLLDDELREAGAVLAVAPEREPVIMGIVEEYGDNRIPDDPNGVVALSLKVSEKSEGKGRSLHKHMAGAKGDTSV